MVHDYQLTTIGNALKYYGYSFNSNDEKELADAEKLLIASQAASLRHQLRLPAVDAQRRCLDARVLDRRCGAAAPRHAGDAAMCSARRAARSGVDYLCHPQGRAQPRRGLCVDRLPADAGDQRQGSRGPRLSRRPTRAPTSCCRRRCWRIRSSIRRPSCCRRSNSARPQTLTNPLRAEIMARFKSA